MSAQPELLSELCGICYTEAPKYRCPRCSARTCSLPCYKRHQQRASCNGQRDPAAYRKKSQLATPAGIDQDYNYLKSVERGIDAAHRDTQDRGIGRGNASKVFVRGLNRDGPIQQYLIANRIHVTRAPQARNKRIMWTVEWIDGSERRCLQDNSLESDTIAELYRTWQTEWQNAAKRRHAADESSSTATAKRVRSAPDTGGTERRIENADPVAQPNENRDRPQVRTNAESTVIHEADGGVEQSSMKGAEETAAPKPAPPEADETTAKATASDGHESIKRNFYLLRPNTAAGQKVLIPLDPAATLTKALTDRTVLEYPTIYALPYAPADLPDTFLTEEQYLALRKREDKELADALRQAGPARRDADDAKEEQASKAAAKHDPQRILDMLKRDLSAM